MQLTIDELRQVQKESMDPSFGERLKQGREPLLTVKNQVGRLSVQGGGLLERPWGKDPAPSLHQEKCSCREAADH
jgi:hypothetical protein